MPEEKLFHAKYTGTKSIYTYVADQPNKHSNSNHEEFFPAESLADAERKTLSRMRELEKAESHPPDYAQGICEEIATRYHLSSIEEVEIPGYRIKLEKI